MERDSIVDTRKRLTPIHSRGTPCKWNGNHYFSLGSGGLNTNGFIGINLLNSFDCFPASFWRSPKWGESFEDMKGVEIEISELHFHGYIWNSDSAILPTVAGATCRTILLWDNHPDDTGGAPNFKTVFASTSAPISGTQWNVFSPLRFGSRGRFELLYDSWVRVPPNHQELPAGPSQDFFTHEATNPRISMDFIMDMEGRTCRMRRVGGTLFSESESGLPLLFFISDDPNQAITPTWNITWSCDAYWNNNGE